MEFTEYALDLGEYTIRRGKKTLRPFKGQRLELVPYLTSGELMELDKARTALGEDPENEAAFAVTCDALAAASKFSDWKDRDGEPLGDPTDPDTWHGVPAGLMNLVMTTLLNVESEGEG